MGELEPVLIQLSFKRIALGFGIRKFGGVYTFYLSILFLLIDIEFRKPKKVNWIKIEYEKE